MFSDRFSGDERDRYRSSPHKQRFEQMGSSLVELHYANEVVRSISTHGCASLSTLRNAGQVGRTSIAILPAEPVQFGSEVLHFKEPSVCVQHARTKDWPLPKRQLARIAGGKSDCAECADGGYRGWHLQTLSLNRVKTQWTTYGNRKGGAPPERTCLSVAGVFDQLQQLGETFRGAAHAGCETEGPGGVRDLPVESGLNA